MTECIEKQAALDIVNGWRDQLIFTYGNNDEYVKCLETVAEHIELLHGTDIRPAVIGKWIPEPNRYYHWHCSECGYTVGVVRMDCKYCPNCGAYMKGGENNCQQSD